MPKINILSAQEAQKIAAGEVVERPANIVKELVENALDAGATDIALYLEDAGKKLIRIVDNGCGMDAEDARLCMHPHATSKISCLDDLASIASFGFRGEALASIAAVSKVELATKAAQSLSAGVRLVAADGAIHHEEEIGCPIGTDLRISELFFNTPARKKFLKQSETEFNHTYLIMQAFSLSNPAVRFRLFHNGSMIFNLPQAATRRERIAQLWDGNLAKQLIDLATDTGNPHIQIAGLISHHQVWRYNRRQIFFFVNNRFVKNPGLSKALLKGYQNVLPQGRFPVACIFITAPGSSLDVNVHPRKEEVAFAQSLAVEATLQRLVKQTLEEHIRTTLHKSTATPTPQFIPAQPTTFTATELPRFDNIFSPLPTHPARPTEQQASTISIAPSKKIIGQFLNTYILLEGNDCLLMVDQHAAHERVLYEKFRKKFNHRDGTHLLFPEIIQLSAEHIALLTQENEFFADHGIEIEQMSSTSVVVKTAPPKLQGAALKELIDEAIAWIEEHHELDQESFRQKLHEHMHSQMACKAAVKAGDELSNRQIEELIADLENCENRYICAHGRPTLWEIGKDDFEKQFKRRC